MTKLLADISNYCDLKVTIMGLGSFGGGTAAVRFFAEQGAQVTITDLRTAAELSESLELLADVPIRQIFLGGHPDQAFDEIELLVANPAVKSSNQIIRDCKARGVTVTTEIEVFLHHNPGRVIAVTGTNGKSTTATLIRDLLQSMCDEWSCQVFLGGNVGVSLLTSLPEIEPIDFVVLELSSFQLEYLREAGFAPEVAVMTNFAPNHLDWHGTSEQYRSAKQVLFNRQMTDQTAILPAVEDDDLVLPWRIRGRCLRFGLQDFGEAGVYVEDGLLVLRDRHAEEAFRLTIPRQLRGQHNEFNIAAAACAAWSVGAKPELFQKAILNFEALPHRLQLVAEGRGLRFYDDSVATTPESAIAALRSFSEAVVILAGGADKGVDLAEFCEVINVKASAAVLMGDTAGTMKTHLSELNADQRMEIVLAGDFHQAFAHAVALATPGSIVLLSPGCASFGWFRDFRHRGQQFIDMSTAWISE